MTASLRNKSQGDAGKPPCSVSIHDVDISVGKGAGYVLVVGA